RHHGDQDFRSSGPRASANGRQSRRTFGQAGRRGPRALPGARQNQGLTAEGRLQALVLLLLPPAMFVILLLLNPAYGQVLLGKSLFLFNGDILLLMGIFELLGAVWINKIVNFDF